MGQGFGRVRSGLRKPAYGSAAFEVMSRIRRRCCYCSIISSETTSIIHKTFHFAVPLQVLVSAEATFLIPFLIEPIATIYAPYKLMVPRLVMS